MSDWSGYDESGVGSAGAEAQAQALHGLWQKFGNSFLGRLAQGPLSPGRAAGGQYDTQAATPGMWTDEDEARSQLNNQAMHNQAGDLANLAVGGGLPGAAKEAMWGSLASRSRSTLGSTAGGGGGRPFEVLNVKRGPYDVQMHRDTEVLKNPSRSDFLRLLREEGEVRTLADKEGNSYAWPSEAATHEGMALNLRTPIGDWGDEWFMSKGRPYQKKGSGPFTPEGGGER